MAVDKYQNHRIQLPVGMLQLSSIYIQWFKNNENIRKICKGNFQHPGLKTNQNQVRQYNEVAASSENSNLRKENDCLKGILKKQNSNEVENANIANKIKEENARRFEGYNKQIQEKNEQIEKQIRIEKVIKLEFDVKINLLEEKIQQKSIKIEEITSKYLKAMELKAESDEIKVKNFMKIAELETEKSKTERKFYVENSELLIRIQKLKEENSKLQNNMENSEKKKKNQSK